MCRALLTSGDRAPQSFLPKYSSQLYGRGEVSVVAECFTHCSSQVTKEFTVTIKNIVLLRIHQVHWSVQGQDPFAR